MGYRRDALVALLRGHPTERKQSMATAAIVSVGPFQARWMQQDYEAYVREGYATNPYVFAGIRQIAMAFAGIPWEAYADKTKKNKLPKHPILDLLAQPNPLQGRARFFESLITYLFLDGNSYVERAGPQNGPPIELYTLRPDRVRIIPGNARQPILGYVYKVGSAEQPFPPEYIRHLGFFHPTNDWYGMAPLAAAAKSIDQNNMSKAWNVSLLQNGAQMTGALIAPNALDDIQFARLRSMIDEQHAGFANAGRPPIFEGGLQWQQTGASPQEMSWEAGQKLSAREIATVLNIAPELIGDPESKTFSNYGEARKALYQENILPLADWVRDDLNAWLSPLYSDHPYLDYDKEQIEALQEDRNAVYTRNNQAFVAGWITIEMAQKAAGEDVDKVYGKYYKWQLPTAAQSDPEAPEPEPAPPPVVLHPAALGALGAGQENTPPALPAPKGQEPNQGQKPGQPGGSKPTAAQPTRGKAPPQTATPGVSTPQPAKPAKTKGLLPFALDPEEAGV